MLKQLFAIACLATTLMGAAPLQASAAQKTTKPIYEITIDDRKPPSKNYWMPGRFIAMYSATGQPFEGTRANLSRPYDVDVAKMFEVTNHLCLTMRAAKYGMNGFVWDYRMDMGRRQLGKFKVSCSRARDVVKAYGDGNSEITNVNSLGANITHEYAIPTLNITGAKVSNWMSFTQGAVQPEPQR